MTKTSLIPSRKWIATQVTALAALIVAWINAGSWDKTLMIALVGLISQAIIGYLLPNGEPPASPPPPTGESSTAATAALRN
ncbi:MAG TPA: hypothetical protein VH373_24265 [Jatrophihabitantaceae bacterium]